jgi:hypothetical protein
MCCFFATLVFLGPRFAFLVYWLFLPGKVTAAFNTWIWPLLGLIFLPWATLMYVIVFPINNLDWLWIGLAVFFDIAWYAGGAGRKRVPGYTGN